MLMPSFLAQISAVPLMHVGLRMYVWWARPWSEASQLHGRDHAPPWSLRACSVEDRSGQVPGPPRRGSRTLASRPLPDSSNNVVCLRRRRLASSLRGSNLLISASAERKPASILQNSLSCVINPIFNLLSPWMYVPIVILAVFSNLHTSCVRRHTSQYRRHHPRAATLGEHPGPCKSHPVP